VGKQERSALTRAALVRAGGAVFSSTPFSRARIVDVLQLVGLTQGAFYFHFENKRALALEIINRELELMTELTLNVRDTSTNALSALSRMSQDLGRLIQSDPVVQGGLRLTMQSADEFPEVIGASYIMWFETISQIIQSGVTEGSIRSDIEISEAAEFVVTAFVGSQQIASVNPMWEGLADRLRTTESFVLAALAASR